MSASFDTDVVSAPQSTPTQSEDSSILVVSCKVGSVDVFVSSDDDAGEISGTSVVFVKSLTGETVVSVEGQFGPIHSPEPSIVDDSDKSIIVDVSVSISDVVMGSAIVDVLIGPVKDVSSESSVDEVVVSLVVGLVNTSSNVVVLRY